VRVFVAGATGAIGRQLLPLVALMATAMGIRNAMVRRVAVPDLTTTVLTMTPTAFAAESRAAGGSRKGSIRRR